MKLLVFSDIHLHNWQYGAVNYNGVNSRLLDQFNIFEQIRDYIDKNHIDHIIFCGDLFHSHGKLSASVLKVAHEGIKLLKSHSKSTLSHVANTPINENWNWFNEHFNKPKRFFLVGNHDTAFKDKSIHSLHWLEELDVHVIDNEYHDEKLGLSFLSYTESREDLIRFLAKSQPIAFLHQGVSGIPMGSGFKINEILTEDIVPNKIKKIITGHYHTHKTRGKITVVGSPLQLNWSDCGDIKGFIVYDTDEDEVIQIPTNAPRFINVDLGSANLMSDDFIKMHIRNNFIRVSRYGDEMSLDELRQYFIESGARSVEFIPQARDDIELKLLNDSNEFHLPTLISDYEELKEVSNNRHEIGQELMK